MSESDTHRLHVDGVRRGYGDDFELIVPALDVRPGECLGIVGPTGAGKSTLLRLLGGLDRPTAGTIRFDGEPLDPERTSLATRRRIVTVHQRPQLLAGSVRFNIAYPLRLRSRSIDDDAVSAAVRAFGLESLAERAVRSLSGGQAQLVSMARALVVEPDVLLLDEPTANLDPSRVRRIEEVVAEFRARTAATLVWITHNLFQARRVADRVALLIEGKLVEVAGTETFFESPSNPRTTDFVQGTMVY